MPGPTVMRAMDRLRLTGARRLGFRTRVVDGIHVLELQGRGERPPVVLVHGLASCGLDYVPLMTQLAKRHRRVIAPDLPGHGFSPAPNAGMTPQAIRERLTPALRSVLDEPAIVFGNSLGGLVAIRAALEERDRVLALVLASPGGAPMSEAELTTLLDNFRLHSHELALGFVDRFQGRSQARHVFAWGARIRMKRQNIRNFVEQISREHLLTAEELALVDVPTLVFWGTDDRVLPATGLEFFREHLKTASFVEPPGYGHAPYLDHLGRFVTLVDGFVERRVLAA
ncbi:MAG: alpha/beta hydrolase [Proteobacteria bacterium]|nr:alpha/beta hydrolase [Pseudomonadota bacterium]MCP4922130.1 alpha/beta hydrolase [Pseudomonadota bacterium]